MEEFLVTADFSKIILSFVRCSIGITPKQPYTPSSPTTSTQERYTM